MRIGKLLLRHRAAEGLGVREFAKELGISASTLSRIENGEEMTGENLARILYWMLGKETKQKH